MEYMKTVCEYCGSNAFDIMCKCYENRRSYLVSGDFKDMGIIDSEPRGRETSTNEEEVDLDPERVCPGSES